MPYKKENQINNEGFNNPNSRLTEEEIVTILKLKAQGLSLRQIALQVKCSHTQVRRVLNPDQPRYIYEIRNELHEPIYVGESSNPKVRFAQHKSKVRNSDGQPGLFHGREDIYLMVHPQIYTNQVQSIEAQRALQKAYGLQTDNDKWSLSAKSATKKRKLTDAEVVEIRAKKSADPKLTNVQLGKEYGADYRLIGNIVNRKTRVNL
jgi:hypothetical protein